MPDNQVERTMTSPEFDLLLGLLTEFEEFRVARGYIAMNDFPGGAELYATEVLICRIVSMGTEPRTYESRLRVCQLAQEAVAASRDFVNRYIL